MHNCDNRTCELLNPCLNKLLDFQYLFDTVSLIEEWFNDYLTGNYKYTLDLLGWSREHCVYQLPNLEFVQELAKVIEYIDPEKILEVGSGKGIICRHISNIIGKEIILTDDYSWWADYKIRYSIGSNKTKKLDFEDVIKIDYKDAINRYKPDLIIASWIPYNKFWTKDFRDCSSIKGYILIGESKGGCTGSEYDWMTDWKINYLDDVSKYGICRSDYYFEDYMRSHTNVTYFERV